jgi:septum formation protein
MAAKPSVHQIILASASRARREVLAAAGVAFTVEPADVDEPAIRAKLLSGGAGVDAAEIALVLAKAKAESVSALHPGSLVIGADQVLALDDDVLTKPKDVSAAREALSRLRGKTHELHSAVALAEAGKIVWSHVATARLTMRDFSDAFLDEYIVRAADRVTQSVGSYELEGVGVQLFKAIEGDYFTILGLPLMAVLEQLRERGNLTP